MYRAARARDSRDVGALFLPVALFSLVARGLASMSRLPFACALGKMGAVSSE